MRPFVVKICGVRTVHHARVAADAGADMVGLIFAEGRRRVTLPEAQAITSATYARRPRFVGVFVNERSEHIEHVVQEAGLDLVQLSGTEPPKDCAALRVPYIKVVHVRPGMAAEDVLHITGRYPAATAITLDAIDPTNITPWGGTGQTINHTVAAQVVRHARVPIILAGGLDPSTVVAAVHEVCPAGVDVSSGVETDGVKDDTKIVAFVTAALAAAASTEFSSGSAGSSRGLV